MSTSATNQETRPRPSARGFETLDLAPELIAASPVPIVIKPNAGQPAMEGGRAIYRQDPAAFARDVAEAARSGAAAVGGCCGTDERFLAALRAELDRSAEGDR